MNNSTLRSIRKIVGLLVLMIAVGTAYATPIHYGIDYALPITGTFGANYLLGSEITVTDDFNLTHAGIISRGGGSDAQVGIYSNIGGSPGTLVAQTAIFDVSTAGTLEIPVLSQVDLAPGNYFFMAVYDTAWQNYYTTAAPLAQTINYRNLSFGSALPASFGSPLTFSGQNYSYYLAGDVAAVPVPAAVWLFGSGLLGLVGMARRKKA